MSEQTELQRQVLDWLTAAETEMIALLEQLVNIDSGSYDKEGVDRVGECLADFLRSQGLILSCQPLKERGDILRSDTPAVRRETGLRHNILLGGHRDTVFEAGEAARRPFRIAAGRAYGPGVADMKGGLVLNAFVQAALLRFVPDLPISFLITGDEEIGSAASVAIIAQEAGFARAAFNAEPGRASGNVVTGRKGGFTCSIRVHGRAAHSGVSFGEGRSAISALARVVTALDALTDQAQGITLNTGLIRGGSAVNTVADLAEAQLDVRFVTQAQRAQLIQKIDTILAEAHGNGIQVECTRAGEFAALAPGAANDALAATYFDTALALGQTIAGEFTGGCADSGIMATAGAPTLCGTGPVGGEAHTDREYIELPSLLGRAQILAATILSMDKR